MDVVAMDGDWHDGHVVGATNGGGAATIGVKRFIKPSRNALVRADANSGRRAQESALIYYSAYRSGPEISASFFERGSCFN